MERFTGGCLCGDVRFATSGAPYRVGLCHCLDCRKHHGALFAASAIFPEGAVEVEGEPVTMPDAISARAADRRFSGAAETKST